MEIVNYQSKDSGDVVALFREIFKEWGAKERPSDHMDELHILFHLPDSGLLLLVKDKGELIGTAGIILLSTTDGLIKRFYIKKDYRGTGLAKQLLDELIEKAKSFGISKLVLDVSKKNLRAIRFYEKSGFKKFEVEPQDGWLESNEPEHHWYYYKEIAK